MTSGKQHPKDNWETTGRQMEDTWKTIGRPILGDKWVCVKTPGPRWICGSLLFNRVLNGGIEREVLNGGITGGIERRAFPKQTSHVTNGSKLTFVRVRVPVCVWVCGVCV